MNKDYQNNLFIYTECWVMKKKKSMKKIKKCKDFYKNSVYMSKRDKREIKKGFEHE